MTPVSRSRWRTQPFELSAHADALSPRRRGSPPWAGLSRRHPTSPTALSFLFLFHTALFSKMPITRLREAGRGI